MTLDNKKLLDETGWRILRELQENGRLSFAELGRRVGLTLPAVAERVRKMEEAGIITGYRAEVDPAQVGLPIAAFIHVRPAGGTGLRRVRALMAELPEVLACYHVAGAETFIARVAVPSIEHLEATIERLQAYGQASSSVVLSTLLARRTISAVPEQGEGVYEGEEPLPLRARISRFRPPG